MKQNESAQAIDAAHRELIAARRALSDAQYRVQDAQREFVRVAVQTGAIDLLQPNHGQVTRFLRAAHLENGEV